MDLAQIILSGLGQGADVSRTGFGMAQSTIGLQEQLARNAQLAEQFDWARTNQQQGQEDRVRELSERQAAQSYLTDRANQLGIFNSADPMTGLESSDLLARNDFSRLPPNIQSARVGAQEAVFKQEADRANRMKIEELRGQVTRTKTASRVAAIEKYIRPKFGNETADRFLAELEITGDVSPTGFNQVHKAQASPVDMAAKEQAWSQLVSQIGEQNINPMLLPVLRDKHLRGEKISDTAWLAAMKRDDSDQKSAQTFWKIEISTVEKEISALRAQQRMMIRDMLTDTPEFSAVSASLATLQDRLDEARTAIGSAAGISTVPSLRGSKSKVKGTGPDGKLNSDAIIRDFPGTQPTAQPAALDDRFIDMAFDELGDDADADAIEARARELQERNR